MDFGNKSFFNLKLTSLKMFIKGISLNWTEQWKLFWDENNLSLCVF